MHQVWLPQRLIDHAISSLLIASPEIDGISKLRAAQPVQKEIIVISNKGKESPDGVVVNRKDDPRGSIIAFSSTCGGKEFPGSLLPVTNALVW
jgi:hypothetical protein